MQRRAGRGQSLVPWALVCALVCALLCFPVSVMGAAATVSSVTAVATSNGNIATESQVLTPSGDELVPPWRPSEGGVFSPDGLSVAWVRLEVRNGVPYHHLTVTDRTGSTGRMASIKQGRLALPSWSPDGTRLLMANQNPNRRSRIWIVAADRSAPPGHSCSGPMTSPTRTRTPPGRRTAGRSHC